MDIRLIVADNVRFIRMKRELSQESLAWKSGVSISYLGYIERGEKAITIVMLAKIAKALAISPSLLLEKDAYRKIA